MINSLLDGAEVLLGECTSILEENNVPYLIIGGWASYYLNNKPIVHPGTRDVDILFPQGFKRNELENVLQIFVSNNFIYNAKHHFQLLRKLL